MRYWLALLLIGISGQTQAQSDPAWYWCGSAQQYYPRVASCPEGWREVPAQLPAKPPHQERPGAAPSSEPSTKLIALQDATRPFWRSYALAMAVNQCRLRSNRWFANISEGVQQRIYIEADKTGVSDKERFDADKYGQELMKQVIASTSCAALRNSPQVDQLDALERQITGNYH